MNAKRSKKCFNMFFSFIENANKMNISDLHSPRSLQFNWLHHTDHRQSTLAKTSSSFTFSTGLLCSAPLFVRVAQRKMYSTAFPCRSLDLYTLKRLIIETKKMKRTRRYSSIGFHSRFISDFYLFIYFSSSTSLNSFSCSVVFLLLLFFYILFYFYFGETKERFQKII